MAEIGAEIVKKLRDATNVSMMECKRALVDAGGDMDKALRLLRERGIAVATKKAARAANQGLVASGTAGDGGAASLVEVNCETDFVARNPSFVAFVRGLAERALAADADLAPLVKDVVTAKITEIGENIVVRRNLRMVRQGPGTVASYIHLGGKVGVLVELGCTRPETTAQEAFRELARDLTLHVAACSPRYLEAANVPAEEVASERQIFASQVQNKPPQIVEKIVDGKMRKFYGETCLIEQEFVREPKVPVRQLLADKGKALGDTLALRRFVRYQLGE
jgi:elongation factor Ts